MTQRIKAGDTIRAIRVGRTADSEASYTTGDTFTVFSVEDEDYTGSWDIKIATPLSRYNTGWVSSKDFELVPALPPAMPDPSKVKPGDTVTLVRGTAVVTDVVVEAKSRGVGQFVFYMAENPDPLIPGTYYLVNSGAWTLTDHQPAPEPEPKWKGRTLWVDERGTWYLAGDRAGSPRLYADDGAFVVPPLAGIRPLVVIDPTDERFDQDSLAEVARAAYNSASDVIEWETVANAIRAHLGIAEDN